MWFPFALASAFFAGIVSILAKLGIRTTDSTLATALRTLVVLAFAWLLVFITGTAEQVFAFTPRTWTFLILSGLATGASWLCYFRALQLGNVNHVVPIDKSSVILTVLIAFIFLGEPISLWKALGLALLGIGTYLMIERKPEETKNISHSWLVFALMSAVFAALTSILGKVGMEGIDSNLGTAIRTVVVLVMSWIMVGVTGKGKGLQTINDRELGFIALSGLATGASWLCFFHALQIGPASLVVPLDKLSILVSIAFATLVLHEPLGRKNLAGLALLTAGTLLMLL